MVARAYTLLSSVTGSNESRQLTAGKGGALARRDKQQPARQRPADLDAVIPSPRPAKGRTSSTA